MKTVYVVICDCREFWNDELDNKYRRSWPPQCSVVVGVSESPDGAMKLINADKAKQIALEEDERKHFEGKEVWHIDNGCYDKWHYIDGMRTSFREIGTTGREPRCERHYSWWYKPIEMETIGS